MSIQVKQLTVNSKVQSAATNKNDQQPKCKNAVSEAQVKVISEQQAFRSLNEIRER